MPLTGPHLAVSSDSAALAFCHTSAFSSSGPRTVYNLIFSGCGHQVMMKLETGLIERSFKPGSRSKMVVMREEDTGEIVSHAQWTLPVSDEGEKESKDASEQGKAETKMFEFPDGVNVPLFKKIFLREGASETEKEVELPVRQEECWNLNRIGTKPECRGKGAATALMKWGTHQADLEGKFCNLWTDPEQPAFHSYKKAGFEVVGNISEMELEPFGSSGILRYVRMIRYPQKTK